MKTKKTIGKSVPASSVDLAEVERLLEFMNEHGLEEFEYARGDFHICLRKSVPSPEVWAMNPSMTAPRMVSAPEIVVAGAEPASAPATERAAAAEPGDLHVVKSPIVGTFYGAPSPGAESFVKLGDQVSAGQVLCIIEAMKLMNEIESDAAGEVVRIYVENGQPVEYGQPLFAIRPTHKK